MPDYSRSSLAMPWLSSSAVLLSMQYRLPPQWVTLLPHRINLLSILKRTFLPLYEINLKISFSHFHSFSFVDLVLSTRHLISFCRIVLLLHSSSVQNLWCVGIFAAFILPLSFIRSKAPKVDSDNDFESSVVWLSRGGNKGYTVSTKRIAYLQNDK